jgi:hypothetical protein
MTPGDGKDQVIGHGIFNDAIYCIARIWLVDDEDNNLNDDEDIDDEFEDENNSLKSIWTIIKIKQSHILLVHCISYSGVNMMAFSSMNSSTLPEWLGCYSVPDQSSERQFNPDRSKNF